MCVPSGNLHLFRAGFPCVFCVDGVQHYSCITHYKVIIGRIDRLTYSTNIQKENEQNIARVSTGVGDADREVRVRALAGSLCCVLGQDTLLSQCPSSSLPRSKWVPANCQGSLTKCWEEGGITCDGLASHPGRVAIFRFMLQKPG